MIRKLFVNTITLSRVVLSILYVICIITYEHNIFLFTALFALICMTDFFDGKLARRLSVSSKMGAVFDVLTDLLFIFSSCTALIIIKEFPIWMLAVIVAKFLEFCITSSVARKMRNQSNNIFMFDRLGRIVVVLYYVLPYIALLLDYFIVEEFVLLILNVICFSLAIASAISSVQRINVCIRQNRAVIN